MTDKTCEACGQSFKKKSASVGRFCSKRCYGQYLHDNPSARNHFKPGTKPWNKGLKGYHAGSQHWHWNGGKRRQGSGYIEMYCPEHPYARHGGYVYEHRLVMEQIIGRFLEPEEQVHHQNGIKDDNRPENVRLFANNSEHRRYHSWLKKQQKSSDG